VRARLTTGERVVTQEGGFNPTWRCHVAAYRLLAPRLGGAPGSEVLDLGCGVGHSFRELGRPTVGVDLDAEALRGQDRPTVVADMRDLPFRDGQFAATLSVHSLEHVPDPERILREARRVTAREGTVAFVTPNRLTFSPPGEIVDPYHWVEFDAAQLRALCEAEFGEVELLGLHGSPRYLALWEAEQARLRRLLRLDPLGVRHRLPRRALQVLYDAGLTASRRRPPAEASAITAEDFRLEAEGLDGALDLVAVCRS
jgi:SAM-dependent methyltransferase